MDSVIDNAVIGDAARRAAAIDPTLCGRVAVYPIVVAIFAESAAEIAQMPQSRRFVVSPADLFCKEAYTADSENSLRRDDLLEYDARVHRQIDERTIFWGPYIVLDPGVYLFSLHGKLDGEVLIDFSHSAGKVLKQMTINSFDQPLCLAVIRPIKTFEVRAHRTPNLKFMRLEGVAIDYIAVTGNGQ
jgi:hypothetical protein